MIRPMFRTLGNTPVKLPVIGQGFTQVGSYESMTEEKDRSRIEALRYGIELGFNFLDTAELYGGGHSEEVVGKAVRGMRERVFIASKFNAEHGSFQGVIRAAEGSLRRLQTDYLDLYQMHWPNPEIPIDETLRALHSLVEQGKVRFIGVSNFTVSELAYARLASSLPIVSNQMEYNLFERSVEKEMLPYCQREGVTLLAYSPLDRGGILKEEPPLRLLQSLAGKYQKTVVQITLNWLLSHQQVIALVKAGSREHIIENAQATTFKLESEDIALIDSSMEQKIILVPPVRIRVAFKENQRIYRTVDEALHNPQDLIPSPRLVANNILQGHFLKPLALVMTSDLTGEYKYDLVDNSVLYWAWVIARGVNFPMPCFIKDI